MAVVRTYNIGFTPGTGANREDLLDRLSMISPADTPFVATAPRSEAMHVRHDWNTDTLSDTATGGQLEGADFATSSFTTRPRLYNVCQIFRRTVKVSNTQRAVDPAGVDDEYRYQAFKMGREIHRNIEVRLWGTTGLSATGASNSARILRNIPDFIGQGAGAKFSRHVNSWEANVTSGATTASASGLQEVAFNNALQFVFHQGGATDVVWTNSHGKRYINEFAGNSRVRRNIPLDDRRLISPIDVYESEWGLLEIGLNRWVPRAVNSASDNTDLKGGMFFLERALVRIAVLRPIKHVPLPPVGDSTRGMVIGELTLECGNPSGLARMYGLSSRQFTL